MWLYEFPIPGKTDVLAVCPEFDSDCLTMSLESAQWCHAGMPGHPCGGPQDGIGKACGHCPIVGFHN